MDVFHIVSPKKLCPHSAPRNPPCRAPPFAAIVTKHHDVPKCAQKCLNHVTEHALTAFVAYIAPQTKPHGQLTDQKPVQVPEYDDDDEHFLRMILQNRPQLAHLI